MDIKVIVATHKKYRMPEDSLYLPLHVGREGKEDLGYRGDNEGDNISIKNDSYCEITALYWGWKNLNCDYIGLCHYRRYFTDKNIYRCLCKKDRWIDLVVNKEEIINKLRYNDIIVPKKRNYLIETVWSHYKNAHYIKDMLESKKIIKEKYPEYLDSFEKVMNGSSLYLYNMFVMDRRLLNHYCQWLFDILFALEKRTDIVGYNNYQKRVFGFISERLFNVWIDYNLSQVYEMQVINAEKINWKNKIVNFLKRKYGRVKNA